MKKISIIILLLSVGLHAKAQLNIVPQNDEVKEYTVQNAQPYDSLTNEEKKKLFDESKR